VSDPPGSARHDPEEPGERWQRVEDPDDPRIEVFQGLRDHDLRQRRERPGGDRHGVFIAEGDLLLERGLAAGYTLLSVLVDGTRAKPLPAQVPAEVPVYAAGRAVVQRITGLGVHRGAIACFRRRPPPAASDLLATARRIVVLERVNNPNNVGLILRSVAGLGIDAALLDPSCADPLYRRSSRVAMGTVFDLPWSWLEALPDGLSAVRDAGFEVVALTPAAEAEPLTALTPPASAKVALLLGSEGHGLSGALLSIADRQVRIPMARGVDSLNVGVAAAIACYQLVVASPAN